MKKHFWLLLLIAGHLLLTGHASFAGSFMDNLMDPSDGKFDVGDWLTEQKGFLPVPFIITEPAVGYGGGL